MHVVEKTDIGVVPVKAPNKIVQTMAEVPEGRPVTEGNSEEEVCDLDTETGENIERTRQNTQRGKKG